MAQPISPRFCPALLLFVFSAASPSTLHASIVDYTLQFVTTSGPDTATGSFSYDTTLQQFDSLSVSIAGLNFNLTSAANGVSLGASNCPAIQSAAALFTYLTVPSDCPGAGWYAEEFVVPSSTFNFNFYFYVPDTPLVGEEALIGGSVDTSSFASDDNGTFSASQTAAPEPAQLPLALLALSGIFVAKRRIRTRGV
jgi:hypothetical protein